MARPLTQSKVRTEPAAKSGKRKWMTDGACPGLTLRVTDLGHKSWWLRRKVAGKTTTVRLGDHPTMTLEDARAAVKAHRDGPSEAPAPSKTLADAWDKFKVSRWPALSEWTQRDYSNRWRAHLGPALGSKSLDKITGGHVQDLYDSLRETRTTANHVLALFSTIWSYAAGRGDMGITPTSPNPTKVITKATRYRKGVRTRRATPAELRAFLRGVDEAEADGRLLPHEAVGLLLVPYSLLRITDVVRLRWAWVDLKARTITIPWEHAKGARIARDEVDEVAALAEPMVSRLRALKRDGEYVVPSNRGGSRYELKDPYNIVRPAKDLGLYDFKTTSETMLREAGVAQGWIDAAARHRPQSVGQRHYAHGTVTQALNAIDRLAALLDAAREADVTATARPSSGVPATKAKRSGRKAGTKPASPARRR